MSEKTKYCEKALSKYTKEFLEKYESLKKQPTLNPGDVVFLRNTHNPKAIKESHGVKHLFKVESTHETGLVIARRILPRGKLGASEIINDGVWVPVVDDTFIENTIMGNDNYDPSTNASSLELEKRKIYKYNKSISFKTRDQKTIEDFINSLDIGDKFWSADTTLELHENMYEVIEKPKIMPKAQWHDAYLYVKCIKHWGKGFSYSRDITAQYLGDTFVTKTEPMKIEDKTK